MFNEFNERELYEFRQQHIMDYQPIIEENRDKRGCPNWHEYARVFRVIPVQTRKVAIGIVYVAYMPTGVVFTSTNLRDIEREAAFHECRSIQMVGAA